MNDDEFLSQFRKPPRQEFNQSLRKRLARHGWDEEGETMNSHTVSLNGHVSPVHLKTNRWENRLTLSAAMVALLIFIGVILTISRIPIQLPTPIASPVYSGLPVISRENVTALERLAQLGNGVINEAVWSPDGKLIAMPGSVGVWIFDATDLSKPLYNIYPELPVYTSLVFSNDSTKLAFGFRVWDLVAQKDVTPPFESMTDIASTIALNPDSSVMAVADYQGALYFYDMQTGALLSTVNVFLSYTPIFNLNFNPDGTRLAFSGPNTPLLILEDPTGQWADFDDEPVVFRPNEQSEAGTQNMGYSADGTRLAVRVGNTIVIWDAVTGNEIARLDTSLPVQPGTGGGGGMKGGGGDVTFSPDGTQLATVDEMVRIWDIASGTSRILMDRDPANPYSVGNIQFSSDWTHMSVVNTTGFVRILDVATGQEIAQNSDYTLLNVIDVAIAPNNTSLVSASDDGYLRLWDLRDLYATDLPDESGYTILPESHELSTYGLQRVAYSPDGQWISNYRFNGDVWRWNVATGELADSWTAPQHATNVIGFGGFIAYSADGTRLASTSLDGKAVWVWDTATGAISQTIDVSPEMVSFGGLSADGRTLAVAVRPDFGIPGPGQPLPESRFVILIYDLVTAQIVKTLEGHVDEIRRIAFSPDGKWLVSAAIDGSIYLWNVKTGQITHKLMEANANQAVGFSPDGQLIAGVEWTNDKPGSDVILWDAATGEEIGRLHEIAGIQTVTFSADGSLLATGLANGTIQVWGVR